MKINKLFLKKIILFIVIIIIIILLLEVFFRLYFFNAKALIPKYGSNAFPISQTVQLQASDNCKIIFEWKKNLDTTYKLSDLKTNEEGLRDKTYSKNKSFNVTRIVVIGDSCTTPSGVNIEDAYHTILEQYYNSNILDKEYEFINFGVPGYTLSQYLEVLKNKSLGYNPDYAIIGIHLGNDIPVNNELYEGCRIIIPRKFNYYFSLWSFIYFKEKYVDDKPEHKPIDISEYNITKLDEILREFKEIEVKNNISIIFVTLRKQDTLKTNLLIFNRSIQKNNLSLIDTASYFKKHWKEYIIYRYDFHPNKEANSLFAQAIIDSKIIS